MAFGKPLYLGQTETEQLILIHKLQGNFHHLLVEKAFSPLRNLFSRAMDAHSTAARRDPTSYSYVMNTQNLPYVSHYWSNETLKDICLKEKLPQDTYASKGVRAGFYHFVAGCLRLDISQRFTPIQAQSHPFSKFHQHPNILKNFTGYSPPSHLDMRNLQHSPSNAHVQSFPTHQPSFLSPYQSHAMHSQLTGFYPDQSLQQRLPLRGFNLRNSSSRNPIPMQWKQATYNPSGAHGGGYRTPQTFWAHEYKQNATEQTKVMYPRRASYHYNGNYNSCHRPQLSQGIDYGKFNKEMTFSRASFSQHSRTEPYHHEGFLLSRAFSS